MHGMKTLLQHTVKARGSQAASPFSQETSATLLHFAQLSLYRAAVAAPVRTTPGDH